MKTSGRLAGGVRVASVAIALAASAVTPLAAQQKSAPMSGASGVDTTNLDRSVRPQDRFSEYVNGSWLKKTEIPADRSTWGSFAELRENAARDVRAIVEEAARSPGARGSNTQKIGDLYADYMETARIEAAGLAPLRPRLRSIAALASAAELPRAFAAAQRTGEDPAPFDAGVYPDPKQSSVHTVSISQAGLGLPDRDYYLRGDEKFAGIRKAYVDYITRLFTLAGQPDPAGAAGRILALETRLAEKQWDRVRNRDRNATYNRMTVADLHTLTPSFDWPVFLGEAGMPGITEVIVRQPDYLRAVDSILVATPISTWRELMTFRLLSGYAAVLPAPYATARFDFYGRVIEGLKEPPARWKRGVGVVENALGEAVGQIYVQRHFQSESKARMDAIVRNILASYRVAIDSLPWMSPATKAQAQAKLARFGVKIGYPDRWRDYSALQIRRGDLVGNLQRAQAFHYNRMVSRLGKPVDRGEWSMSPQTVNAYYSPTNNEIAFPAAILQPPFFNVKADDAVNYGAIGAVIGHEISHGFDDQGSKSDGEGNLRDWWTPEDLTAFRERTEKLVRQYDAYEALPGIHINGKLTLGENIGDISGIAAAYRAYKLSLGGREAPVIDGFTGDQRFFMGYAQIWRTKMRDEAMRNLILTDPHTPGMYRAFVPLTNFEPFYRAWHVQPGDGMWRAPEERVKIW